MDEAPSTDESAEDMVAAETAPRPQNDTYAGVRYCSTMGKIMRACSSVRGTSPLSANAVWFQSANTLPISLLFAVFAYFNKH